MSRNLLLVLSALTVFTACKKDDDEPAGPTRTQLLTTVPWKLDTAGIDANSDGSIDTPLPDGTIEDCDKDNTFTFQATGTGTVDEGPTKCDAADPQTVEFNYSLNSNATIMNFPDTVISGISGDVTIKELTATRLVLTKSLEIGLPIPVNVVVEMKH